MAKRECVAAASHRVALPPQSFDCRHLADQAATKDAHELADIDEYPRTLAAAAAAGNAFTGAAMFVLIAIQVSNVRFYTICQAFRFGGNLRGKMVTTRSSVSKTATVETRTRSKGLSGQTATLATRTKLDNTIKCLDKELKLCKAFIVKNLKIHETVESQVRRVITTRERTFRLFEEWRDQLDKQHLQLFEFYVVRDSAIMELHDLEAEPIPDIEVIADLQKEIADLTTKIEQILVDEAEIERNIRRIKTIFTDVERCLQTYKVEHEAIHTRLCQKLAFIARSRHRAITERKGLGTTKNGKKI